MEIVREHVSQRPSTTRDKDYEQQGEMSQMANSLIGGDMV
jgi:hypothetical protein